MNLDPRLHDFIQAQPYPLLFATVTGSHLYGFPSPNSDYDVGGAHLLPLVDVLGLATKHETIQTAREINGLKIDIATHDAKKFFLMLLKKDGNVLEQLYSPLILASMPEFDELKAIVKTCITRHHSHHYIGFADRQWHMFDEEQPRRVKPLLYTYRILLTGIHLMQTGEIEANLLRLNEHFNLHYIPDLVARKLAGAAQSTLDNADMNFFAEEYKRLRTELDAAFEVSTLPEAPQGYDALSDLLVRLRMR